MEMPVPVTAKFSEEFYARLGHGVADELVDWFNQVDETYRSDFRDLFDTNFARLDAKLEQRTGELRAHLEAKIERLRAEFDAKLEQRIAGLEVRLIRWMFLFWIGTLGTLVALIKL